MIAMAWLTKVNWARQICWYILEAEYGAEIIYDHNAQSKEELRQQIKAGDWDKLLTHVPVKKGDFFFVRSWHDARHR